jgi:hypothetical protein
MNEFQEKLSFIVTLSPLYLSIFFEEGERASSPILLHLLRAFLLT